MTMVMAALVVAHSFGLPVSDRRVRARQANGGLIGARMRTAHAFRMAPAGDCVGIRKRPSWKSKSMDLTYEELRELVVDAVPQMFDDSDAILIDMQTAKGFRE